MTHVFFFFLLLVSRVIKSWECFCHVWAGLRRVYDLLRVPTHIPTQQSVNWNILFVKTHILDILITLKKNCVTPTKKDLCVFYCRFCLKSSSDSLLNVTQASWTKLDFFLKGCLDTSLSAVRTI